MSAITVGGDLVHYEVLGRGRPVILLHGWLGSWRYWIPVMRLLQLKYRVYALDFFGYGDSGKNPARYTPAQQVVLLQEFMKELGIPKAALIGHGMGAQIILHFTREQPDKVARMMLVSAPLFDPPDLANRIPPDVQRPLTGAEAAETVANRPEPPPPSSHSDATIPSVSNRTMGANSIDRQMLREEARRKALAAGAAAMQEGNRSVIPSPLSAEATPPPPLDPNNPLQDRLNLGLEVLVQRCFRRADADYKTIEPDLPRMDDRVLLYASARYDAGMLLDTLRTVDIPTVIAHGVDDPIITPPSEAALNYISAPEKRAISIFPLRGTKHFPMIEHEPFLRLVSQFLESPDVTKIELKDRWVRRTR